MKKTIRDILEQWYSTPHLREIINHRITEQPKLEGTQIIISNCLLEKGIWKRVSCTLYNYILKIFNYSYSYTSLGRLFCWLIALTVKHSFLYQDKTPHGAACTFCPLSSPCGSLWWQSFHCLSHHLLNFEICTSRLLFTAQIHFSNNALLYGKIKLQELCLVILSWLLLKNTAAFYWYKPENPLQYLALHFPKFLKLICWNYKNAWKS